MRHPNAIATSIAVALGLYGAGASAAPSLPGFGHASQPPSFIKGAIRSQHYDGSSDDLLTAGLGKTGLAGPPPAYADPARPTAAELRRAAIWTNYRAVLDIDARGGYGTLYGPNVTVEGTVTTAEGKIAGTETIAYADDGSGRQNVTLMVQVPDSFNPERPCIITGGSSGSRGVYGAIGTSGEWGLKRGCAVAYHDKGNGNGFHDVHSNRVNLIDGTTADAAAAGNLAHFRADLGDVARSAYNAAFPHRVAYKHAHSQQNPERDWGKNTLQAIEFAFHVLNQKYGSTGRHGQRRMITPANTLVIASSISNGGTTALAAAEQDRHGLIDAVVVGEPSAQPRANHGLVIRRGAKTITTHSKPLVDYFTYANLYQPCAALAVANSPGAYLLSVPNATNRCTALAAKGLVSGSSTAEQAADALARLHAYGWEAEHDVLHSSHFRLASPAVVLTYTNTLGRFSVADNLCGFSFANTDAAGSVIPQNPVLQASLFANGNGIPPTAGINIVYNDAVGGARLDLLATSPSSGLADFALDGALCQRALVTGIDPVTGRALSGTMRLHSQRVQKGIHEVQLNGNLHGKPTIIVAGRSDALVLLNHSARAYYGKLQMTGAGAAARYIEVTNANHFDTFIDNALLPGYDTRMVPLHHYLLQALDAMWAHLHGAGALPASQVVRTVPRGGVPGAAPAITLANLPAIATVPARANAITFAGNTLSIPD